MAHEHYSHQQRLRTSSTAPVNTLMSGKALGSFSGALEAVGSGFVVVTQQSTG